MLKILQARLQQNVNCELPDVQAGFRKVRGARDQMTNICLIIEKARVFQKTSISALLTEPPGKWKQWLTLFFWAPKSLQMVIAAIKLKDAYSLEEKL